jgi:copper chaperone
MTCSGCAKGVAATLRDTDPGAEPRFDLERREVAVEKVSVEARRLEQALEKDGWKTELLAG